MSCCSKTLWVDISICLVECDPGDALMTCSLWVRKTKQQTVHLCFLAFTLGLRSTHHKLHTFITTLWTIPGCLRWAEFYWFLSEVSIDKECIMCWLSVIPTNFSPSYFCLTFYLYLCSDAFYHFSSVLLSGEPEGFDCGSTPVFAQCRSPLSWTSAIS